MSNPYDVLEICLQEIENGADVDTVLFHYPEFAEKLRPILEASVQARSLAVSDPSPEVMRRSKAGLLQRAAQMREAKARPSRRLWSVPLRRALVSLAVIAVLFMGSTGLVHASTTTLPGDNLYPVKRTWEDLRVLLTFNIQAREALEVERENERLHELNELFAEGRSAKVDFAGTVTSQNGNVWLVSKIPVQVSAKTELGAQVPVGSAIRVRGFTQADGMVLAERVELLPAGIPLPSVEDDHESVTGQATPETEDEDSEDDSNTESVDPAPDGKETEAPEENDSQGNSSINGVVDSVNGNTLVVNGQSMDISNAELNGTPTAGISAKVEGYYDANGVFIVTKIEFQNSGSDSSVGSDNGGNDDKSGDQEESGSDDQGGDDNGGSSSGSGEGGGD